MMSTPLPDEPDLQEAVERLARLAPIKASNSPKSDVQVYALAVAFLVHLEKDRQRLLRWRSTPATAGSSSNGEDENSSNVPTNANGSSGTPPPFPPASEMPAVSAVLHNERFFSALLRCLYSSHETSSGPGLSTNSITMGLGNSSSDLPTSRKRSLSMSGNDMSSLANKVPKASSSALSPKLTGRKVTSLAATADRRSVIFDWAVWAATVLNTAFQHLDHWPVPLIHAYATDAFGARLWVDDADCASLVQNLALALDDNPSSGDSSSPLAQQHASDAAAVEAAYRNFNLRQQQSMVLPTQGSLRSLSSSSSMGRKSKEDSSSNGIKRPRNNHGNNEVENSDSSSSGEEDNTDADILMSGSNDDESSRKSNEKVQSKIATSGKDLYPVPPRHTQWTRVRARYFGTNLEAAHRVIGAALQERIDQKSKQNSGLLQALPSFAGIPKVRFLVTQNLEKWLQSPALAGLSRALFAATVAHMKNVDPPLREDVQAIDFILDMKLKANQFAAHMENVTAIAKKIPTATVANHMYTSLFQRSIEEALVIQNPSSEYLAMIAAIHKILPARISYEAIAYSLLMLLLRGRQKEEQGVSIPKDSIRWVQRLRKFIRALAAKLSPAFDGFQVLVAFLQLQTSEGNWTIRDEEDKARLMLQCVTLFVASQAGCKDPSKSPNPKVLEESPTTEEKVRNALRQCRRVLLQWCCSDYGPRYSKRRRKKLDSDIFDGSASPDFVSALGPNAQEESVPAWLNTMRCLLLIEDMDTDLMDHFLCPPDASDVQLSGWVEEKERISFCASLGVDIDDEMISVILKSSPIDVDKSGMSPDMSIRLIEHLFESCGKRRGAVMNVSEPDLVWEMYKLAHYTPSRDLISLRLSENEEGNNDYARQLADLPRLAYTGLWWRVTILGLVLCGSNPKTIGAVLWKDHPTMCCLIKMVSSNRYRFPTVDCDHAGKAKMKNDEQTARDEETRVAELLFLPPKRKKKPEEKGLGSRISRRLQEQQQQREAAAQLAESSRRKKLVRSAQKALMLWDPDGPARKPPRECAELLVSAESIFGLSNSFQKCTNPDFLLNTVGGTNRDAIERAYDWLIPVISRTPDTISRLPSRTSCFLLLRAYGADAERRQQLRELSAPLLKHVRDSLTGSFAEAEAVQAFDILLGDAGSHHSDRRKSARRVLKDALEEIKTDSKEKGRGSKEWMLNIIRVKHAPAAVPTAMTHLATAAKFERGKVLRSIVVTLRSLTEYAEERGLSSTSSFPMLLSLLVSQRPNVYAEAIDAFPDFRSLVVKVIHGEFVGEASTQKFGETERKNTVSIKLRKADESVEEKLVPPSLLHTTCIVLSVWSAATSGETEELEQIESLVDALMLPSDQMASNERTVGLASAINVATDSTAMSVDSWIMLCKARSEVIGKRAALSVPEPFLGRLLLSSGLPRTSLVAMVDRICRLGSASTGTDSTYRNLLVPSASSEWDIGRVGTEKTIARRLLGRLSAYSRAGALDEVSSKSFVEWLREECREQPKPKPGLMNKATSSKETMPIAGMFSIWDALEGPSLPGEAESIGPAVDPSDLDELLSENESLVDFPEESRIMQTLDESFSKQSSMFLDQALAQYETKPEHERSPPRQEIALLLANQIRDLAQKPKWTANSILKWLPIVSRTTDSIDLWRILFTKQAGAISLFLDELVSACLYSWTETHVHCCSKWINSLNRADMGTLSACRLANFMVKTSSLRPPDHTTWKEDQKMLDARPEWGNSQAHASLIVNLCILAAVESSQNGHVKAPESGHSLPAWLILLQMLGSRGKQPLDYATENVLLFFKENPSSTVLPLLDNALLRLYLLQPKQMNVGSSPVRTTLLRASEASAHCWTEWPCSVDELLEAAVTNLPTGSNDARRLLQDHARRHPLLILRQTKRFVDLLENDATLGEDSSSNSSLVHASSLRAPLEARWMDKTVRIHVRHWGFAYTESLWNTVLDIFLGIPKEVLFQSGLKLGFLALLNCYLRLLWVQMDLLTGDATTKLKAKFAEVLRLLEASNRPGCQAWWNTPLEDDFQVRNALVATDLLSPQQAIQSIRSSSA